jgi:hypothetical protein
MSCSKLVTDRRSFLKTGRHSDQHFTGVVGEIQITNFNGGDWNQCKGLFIFLDDGAAHFGHDGLLFISIDRDGCAVDPSVGAQMPETDKR